MNYNKNNPLKVATVCSGYDSMCLAFDRLKEAYPDFDYDLVLWSEFDPESTQPLEKQPAVIAHNALFPQWANRNQGDMTKIDWSVQPDFDLLFYSTPCFVAGTLVLTSEGYKPIEDVKVGDRVLTHNNRYRKVLKTGSKPHDDYIYEINGMSFHRIFSTGNHPFYVRERYRYGHKSIRAFREPCWVKAESLSKDHYLGVAINQESAIPRWDGSIDNRWGHQRQVNKISGKLSSAAFWYLIGRYVGDGWRRNDECHKAVIIACSERNEDSLIQCLDSLGWKYTKTDERTCTKVTLYSRELCEFVGRYGYYAHGKYIDADTINLPQDLLKSFVDGYIDSDGCFDKEDGHWHITTVSRKLALGFVQCVAKVYHAPCKVNLCKMRKTAVIEGRVVNQRDFYIVRFKKEVCKQDKAFYEDGYIWIPINDIVKDVRLLLVYNLEVEEDNSYTANGVIVHNCQSISQAGLQHGFTEGSGTRSSIIWNVRDAVKEKRPKYLCLENVKAMVSGKFVGMFNLWQSELEKLGYASFAQILDSKNYGIPQHRERIFLVSIRIDDEEPRFHFPVGFPLELCLLDMLEDNVDEKFFLNDDMLARFCERSLEVEENNEIDNDDEFDFNLQEDAECLRGGG